MLKTAFTNQLLAGLKWGMLWTMIVVFGIFLVFPVFSLPLLLGIAGVCLSAGIALNLRRTEVQCPRCQTVTMVMPTGSKCPSCGHEF